MNTNHRACHQAPEPKSSAQWVEHFRANVYRDWSIPWRYSAHLTATTHARVARSMAEFQRGESSEALHYLAKSAEFSGDAGDPDFHSASILFVREENGHAALLLRFMRLVAIPQRASAFSDGVFRRLRAFSDLGWSSRVLLVAELIAQDYYPCLRAATTHAALQRICDKIICDEESHIQFQVERIARLEAGVSRRVTLLRDALQVVLMVGTACVVYLGHRPVIESRFGFRAFVTAAWRRNRDAIDLIRRYRATVEAPAKIVRPHRVRRGPQPE